MINVAVLINVVVVVVVALIVYRPALNKTTGNERGEIWDFPLGNANNQNRRD